MAIPFRAILFPVIEDDDRVINVRGRLHAVYSALDRPEDAARYAPPEG